MSQRNRRLKRTLTFIAALAVACFTGSPASGAAARSNAEPAQQVQSDLNRICPAQGDLEAVLGKASMLMQQSLYQDAAALLQPLSGKNCDARVSLVLAAAFEGQVDEHKATEVLQHAHSVWPSN
jgi:hypothetical protein